MRITKLLRKHKKGCDAVRNYKDGTWSSPWFLKEFYQYYRWHRVGRLICNNPDCNASMRIDIKEIEESFNKYL